MKEKNKTGAKGLPDVKSLIFIEKTPGIVPGVFCLTDRLFMNTLIIVKIENGEEYEYII